MLKVYIMAVIAGCLCLSVMAQGKREGFKVTVKTDFLPTPYFRMDNYDSGDSGKLNQQWMAVRVTYTPPAEKERSTGETAWLDNVRMDVEVIFSARYQGQKVYAYTTGKTEFWAVQLDGRRHQAMMLLHPQVLQRYGSEPANNYKKLETYVKVSFYNASNNQLLGEPVIVSNNTPERDVEKIKAAFNRISGPVGSALRLPNLILPVERTPWSLIDIDSYDMTKPNDGK